MTDEAAWQARPEFAKKSAAARAAQARALASKQVADKAGVKKQVTTLDTDHTDEEAWKRREELKRASAEKRRAQQLAIDEANRAYKLRMASADKTKVQSFFGGNQDFDNDITDEEEWLSRPDLLRITSEMKVREKDDLKAKNAEIRARLKAVKPQVEITSEYGKAVYEGENAGSWIDPFVFQGHTPPRSRDKYIQRLSEDYKHDAKALQFAPPSWLKPWEKYEWSDQQAA